MKEEKKRSVTMDDSENASFKNLSKITKHSETNASCSKTLPAFTMTHGTGYKSQAANNLSLKRACDLGDPETLELSELSQPSTAGVVEMEQQITVAVPRRTR